MAQLNLSNISNITDYSISEALDTQGLTILDVDSIYLPWSGCSIGNNAFKNFTNLKTVVGGIWNITSIGDYAFDSTAIITFNAGFDSLITLGKYAFNNCTNLIEISMPACNSVDIGAFNNCTSLETLWLSVTSGKIPKYFLYNCKKLKNTSLFYSDNITAVDDFAFTNCESLDSIIIEGCTYIGKNAFEGCKGVIGINCVNCSNINNYAFKNCSNLETIWVGNISSLNIGVFQNCEKLQNTNLYWNESLTSINNHAFENCKNIITCNPNVSVIGNYAFASCDNFPEEIILPACTEIGRYAFKDCANLSSLTAPNCTFVDYNAFEGTKLWDVPPSTT